MSVLQKCSSYRESNKGSKEKAGTNSKCPFYRGVRLIEVSIKRGLTVLPIRTLGSFVVSFLHVDEKDSMLKRRLTIFDVSANST